MCGDVGFGKTEIAIRAAFKAVADNKQVAILVPTTILALQHYKTFRNRLTDFPCKIDYVSRLKSTKEQKKTLDEIASGKVDIIIGTHKLLGKDIKFKDLGLLVIDEEQKFGVSAKEKLRHLKESVDTLTLTATPIPRTLQFSLMESTWSHIGVILLSLFFSAFFSGVEIAFLSANRLKLELDRKKGALGARIIELFSRHPGQFIATIEAWIDSITPDKIQLITRRALNILRNLTYFIHCHLQCTRSDI